MGYINSTSHVAALTLLEPQSRFGDTSLGIRAVCPQIGTAALKGLKGIAGPRRHNSHGTTLLKKQLFSTLEWANNRAMTVVEPKLTTLSKSLFLVDTCYFKGAQLSHGDVVESWMTVTPAPLGSYD